MSEGGASRRDLISGRLFRQTLAAAGERLADGLTPVVPTRGPTLMLRTAAMGTDFDVLLNPEQGHQQVQAASAALDEVARLEQQYSVYREDSELSACNREAHAGLCPLEPGLYQLLRRSAELSVQTDQAFHPAAGQLIRLWRTARRAGQLPDRAAVDRLVAAMQISCLQWDDAAHAVQFLDPALEFDLGAIGKGYAVDRAGAMLDAEGVENWLVHGGKSSVRVRGGHAGHDGWPIALQNPLLPDRPYLTLLLKDAALSTSGTAVQWFRHEGQRYGHVLDPRTGWPVERMLSVSVIAPDAALADALSTAFFVLGVENGLRCCDNFPEAGVMLFPLPEDGRTLEPVLHNIDAERVFPSATP